MEHTIHSNLRSWYWALLVLMVGIMEDVTEKSAELREILPEEMKPLHEKLLNQQSSFWERIFIYNRQRSLLCLPISDEIDPLNPIGLFFILREILVPFACHNPPTLVQCEDVPLIDKIYVSLRDFVPNYGVAPRGIFSMCRNPSWSLWIIFWLQYFTQMSFTLSIMSLIFVTKLTFYATVGFIKTVSNRALELIT